MGNEYSCHDLVSDSFGCHSQGETDETSVGPRGYATSENLSEADNIA
jgi:hypothetical protein